MLMNERRCPTGRAGGSGGAALSGMSDNVMCRIARFQTRRSFFECMRAVMNTRKKYASTRKDYVRKYTPKG